MSRKNRCATILILIATLALAGSPAWAGRSLGPGVPEAGESAASLLRHAWSWLTSLWAEDQAVPGRSRGDHGCTIDPNGHCTGDAPDSGDPGCSNSPHPTPGGCH
jgi:hypothetical protein